MRLFPLCLAGLLACATAVAEEYLSDPAEVESLLSGATLEGVYLRTGSPYQLHFAPDGTLRKASGGDGRWWVNETGQYCREWLSGRLKGNQACMELTREGEDIAIHSGGRKVAEGTLIRR